MDISTAVKYSPYSLGEEAGDGDAEAEQRHGDHAKVCSRKTRMTNTGGEGEEAGNLAQALQNARSRGQ